MALTESDKTKLDNFWQHCQANRYFNVSYPESAEFDYEYLEKFLSYSLNNCGDWAQHSNYILNTFDFEKEVIMYFSDLLHIPFDESWGYVTNGGTEGNMYGCLLGRELFPDGKLYHTKEAHYSVNKIAKILKLSKQVVKSDKYGEMDYEDLSQCIIKNKEKHPIIFANIGTTMQGAIDDIKEIQHRIARIGFERKNYYLHGDAALSGMILPFVESPQPFNFEDGIDSISISGHKFIGSPIPCGIVMARRKNVEEISYSVDYISAHDRTISGSRNGHTPLMMWAAIKKHSLQEWKDRINECFSMAEYSLNKLKSSGVEAYLNKNSVTVFFPRPSEWVVRKYRLASTEDISHLITLNHLRHNARLDELLNDLICDKQSV